MPLDELALCPTRTGRRESSCSRGIPRPAKGHAGLEGLQGEVARERGRWGRVRAVGAVRPDAKDMKGFMRHLPDTKRAGHDAPEPGSGGAGGWPANRVLAFRGGARPSSPDSGSSPPSTNDIHIRSRNTQRSREYFPRPLLGSGPIPLGRGYKVCAPARARPSARKGACRGADEPALRDLEEGPGVLSEVERTGDKERSCSFFTLLGNCPCAR